MLQDNVENDSEMFSEVYALLDQLSKNSKEIIDIEGKDMDKIEKILMQRTNELSLAVQIAQALMVKHENDSDNINELTKSNNHLKEQQQEYKSLLNQTMESLENNSIKIDSLTKKITSMQVQCEVYEQSNFDLNEEKKILNQKISDTEIQLNKYERDNLRLTNELDVAMKQLKESQASETSLNTELSNLKTKYSNLESTYNEYYNSTQEELLELYEKSGGKDTLYIDENSDISKTRSEGGISAIEGQGQKIETLMQIIDQVSKENAKLKEDYVEIEGLLSEARNEISSLQEQLLSEQAAAAAATVNVSQEIEAYNQLNPMTKSIEVQTDPSPKVKKPKKVDKGTQCNIINVIVKKKNNTPPKKIFTPPPSPSRSFSSITSSIDTGKKNKPKKIIKGNKIIIGKGDNYYYVSPANTRYNSSYAVDGRPRWNI